MTPRHFCQQCCKKRFAVGRDDEAFVFVVGDTDQRLRQFSLSRRVKVDFWLFNTDDADICPKGFRQQKRQLARAETFID